MPQFKLKDGRELEIADNGINSESAIVFHHGTPGHASSWTDWLESAATAGIRAIAYSRAGYGTSDRNPGRSVINVNSDIAQVLDAKNITKFVSIGWSGGGPHCLANTFEPRNVGAISLAGVGAFGVDDLDFLEGMGPENHDEFGAALKGEAVIDQWMNDNAGPMKSVTGSDIIEAFGGLIGDADKAVLEGGEADAMAASMRSALAVSFDGWIDDDLVFVKKWGFELEAITKPVFLWQGDDDFMVPHAHSYWLEKHIPTATLTFKPGEGHISIGVKYRAEILAQAQGLLK
ncbi:alpha/beta fold hydrolase [Candidatus Planktophila dulcis]|uniref:alpha/beta fold hydrolase n=1 Tax=Candidatus Planktophila dulcis TaxID=1884914 RepID=UPI003BEF2787